MEITDLIKPYANDREFDRHTRVETLLCSIDMIGLVLDIEDKYDIIVPDAAVDLWETLGDIDDHVLQALEKSC